MQANNQFNNQNFNNMVKENILPDLPIKAALSKGNALQPIKGLQAGNQLKPTGLSKQQTINPKPNNISTVNNNPTKTALQAKPNGLNQPVQVNKGIQSKINGQKENGQNKNRQSLKASKNEVFDGKIKKIAPKPNSASKANNKKSKKPVDSQKAVANKKETTATATTAQQAKQPECDFLIFCDENDELAIKAVEKESRATETSDETKVEKKKGLAERNVKPQQQNNIQVNLQANVQQQAQQQIKSQINTQTDTQVNTQVNSQANVQPNNNTTTSVQQLVSQAANKIQTKTIVQTTSTTVQQITVKHSTAQKIVAGEVKTSVQTLKSNIELIKEAVVTINTLTLDETIVLDEITLNEQSTLENKENDPTLMSIDLSKDEEMEMQVQDQYKDVSGDMCCKEFSNEIYLYMLERELKYLPDPTYMSKQPEVNSKMRAMLVDWLIDVGIEYELENETVFLTVSYIDQFLSSLTISLQNFQLLGTAALFIASKYEEIYPPELKDFIFVTDDAYTKFQMLSMEKVILKSLNFSVSPPTIFYFLKYFLTKLSLPTYVQYFAEYLCFLSLLYTDPFLSYSPSDIAISSIILALHTYTITDLVSLDEFKQLTKIHFCKDDEGKLSDAKAILIRQSCVNAMYKLQKTAAEDSQQAVYTKYSSDKYLSVATVEIADEVPLVENFFN